MTPEQWSKVKDLVAGAAELPLGERQAFLLQHCADDALRAEAESLLRYAGDPTEAIPPLPGRHLRRGDLVDERYRIEGYLGEGGFAVAYVAADGQLHDRLVVVKVLNSARSLDPRLAAKFTDEARALCAVHHPNVVAPVGIGQLSDGRPYLAMEYVTGRSLRELLPAIRQSPERIASILDQIGSALEAVHAQSIYHRDLKPENIMVQTMQNGEDHVRLIDFGIATLAAQRDAATVMTIAAGSLGYMAPEQAQGVAGRRADIYSLAVIAWEMITGTRPFVAGELEPMQDLQRSGAAALPRERAKGMPAELKDLLVKGLAFDPRLRPDEAGAYARSLAAAIRRGDRRHPIRRRALAVSAGAPILVCAIIGAIYASRPSVPAPPPASPAVAAPVRPVPAPPAIRAALLVRDGRGEPRRIEEPNPVLSGNAEFQIELNPSETGFVYVLTEPVNGTGPLVALFPTPNANSNSSLVTSGAVLRIPKDGLAVGPAGRDRVWVVWKRQADPLLERLREWVNTRHAGEIGDPAERRSVKALLAQMEAAGPSSGENSALCVFEIEHR